MTPLSAFGFGLLTAAVIILLLLLVLPSFR